MNRREWHAETTARLERAVSRLEERSMHAGARQAEMNRLAAKADGVKLALSYLREMPQGIEDEEADNAERLAKARKYVADAYYFADELDYKELAEILGAELEEQ